MKDTTPIMQAIAQIESAQVPNLPTIEWVTYQRCVDILTSLLTAEKEFAFDMYEAGFNNATDDSDFPMGARPHVKQFPDFETLYKQLEQIKL